MTSIVRSFLSGKVPMPEAGGQNQFEIFLEFSTWEEMEVRLLHRRRTGRKNLGSSDDEVVLFTLLLVSINKPENELVVSKPYNPGIGLRSEYFHFYKTY